MATVPPLVYRQGILDPLNNLTQTCPAKYREQVSMIFNSPGGYDISINITRASVGNTVTLYTLTLDPGDTVETVPYQLYPGDIIEVVTTASNVTYLMTVGNILL